MGDPKVTGLRSAEFQVPDLKLATKFYEENWGLEVAAADRDTVYLRGTGTAHHALMLREGGEKKLLAVNLAADNKIAVDGLYEKARVSALRWKRRKSSADPRADTVSSFMICMAGTTKFRAISPNTQKNRRRRTVL